MEKKNYCVDGVCTVPKFYECKYMKGTLICEYWMFLLNKTDQCASQTANAEYQESKR